MRAVDSIPELTFKSLYVERNLYANAYLLAHSTISPIYLPIVRAGICISLAILAASALPFYITFFSGFVAPVIAICFFVLLANFFLFVWPGIVRSRGAKIFDSNQLMSLSFCISFYKSFLEITNENEIIRQYWTEVDRSLETKKLFVILGGEQRPLVLINKEQLSDEQQNKLSSFLEKVMVYKHKKAK